MPILSDPARAQLAAELTKPAYQGADDQAAADILNAPGPPIANPIAAPDIPREIAASGLLAAVSSEARSALATWPTLSQLVEAINAQDRVAVATWAGFLVAVGFIAQADYGAVSLYLAATEPDPAHPATVAGVSPRAALFPAVAAWTQPDGTITTAITAAMVAEART